MLQFIKDHKVLSTVVVAGLAIAGAVAYVVASDSELPEELAEVVEEITEANA